MTSYPIGAPGVAWGDAERHAWFTQQSVERSYHDEVLAHLDTFPDVHQYGALTLDPSRYPLRAVVLRGVNERAPWALITGGVHGYETSGAQGALRFLETASSRYNSHLNMVVAPCVSPWAYETINRWNPQSIDPNRSFVAGSPSEEAAALMKFVGSLDVEFLVHMDLHETTDTDESEFRPAAAARDGVPYEPGEIPDGFYTVGDSENPQDAFQAAVIAGVEPVTHIAPPDIHGQLIGVEIAQRGVINYPYRSAGLCAGMTSARFTTTTEVYPDSAHATPEVCIEAQLAAVHAGLDFALGEPSQP